MDERRIDPTVRLQQLEAGIASAATDTRAAAEAFGRQSLSLNTDSAESAATAAAAVLLRDLSEHLFALLKASGSEREAHMDDAQHRQPFAPAGTAAPDALGFPPPTPEELATRQQYHEDVHRCCDDASAFVAAYRRSILEHVGGNER